MIHKKPLSAYLKKDAHGTASILEAESAQVFVPQRYNIHDLLDFGDITKVLGVFEVQISGEPVNYHLYLPSMLTMCPSSISQRTIDETAYYVFNFKRGDVFLTTNVMMKQDYILSKMFIEFIRNGNIPSFLTYDQMARMFDVAQVTCGVTLPVPHATFEMIFAHCCRDPKDLNRKYRYSDKKDNPVFLGLRNVTHVRDSTTARLVSSHFLEGANSAIVNQIEQRSETEDMLRE